MVSHLKNKPSKESILDTINQSAKLEFDFLLNGIKSTELIEFDPNEIIQLIDMNTKALKIKVSSLYSNTKKITLYFLNKYFFLNKK